MPVQVSISSANLYSSVLELFDPPLPLLLLVSTVAGPFGSELAFSLAGFS
jgi:hypothetical protein